MSYLTNLTLSFGPEPRFAMYYLVAPDEEWPISEQEEFITEMRQTIIQLYFNQPTPIFIKPPNRNYLRITTAVGAVCSAAFLVMSVSCAQRASRLSSLPSTMIYSFSSMVGWTLFDAGVRATQRHYADTREDLEIRRDKSTVISGLISKIRSTFLLSDCETEDQAIAQCRRWFPIPRPSYRNVYEVVEKIRRNEIYKCMFPSAIPYGEMEIIDCIAEYYQSPTALQRMINLLWFC